VLLVVGFCDHIGRIPGAMGLIGNRGYRNIRALRAQWSATFADCTLQIASSGIFNRTTIFLPGSAPESERQGALHISRSLRGPVHRPSDCRDCLKPIRKYGSVYSIREIVNERYGKHFSIASRDAIRHRVAW
jgi:hypothetical protein